MKGVTDDKTNFKRGFWFHLSKAPQKKVFFQKCNGPRICFSAEEKGKRDVLKRHRWLHKQSDGISALKCTFPHIQTLSKTWRRQKNKRKPLLMQSFEVDGPQSRQRFLLGRKISINTCNAQTAWWGPKNAKEWCFLVHGKVLSKSKGWHGRKADTRQLWMFEKILRSARSTWGHKKFLCSALDLCSSLQLAWRPLDYTAKPDLGVNLQVMIWRNKRLALENSASK